MMVKILQPDAKGRITIGKPRAGVVGYQRIDEPDGRITLVPLAALPASEVWLYEDKEALESVRRGIAQSKARKFGKWGSFASHAKNGA